MPPEEQPASNALITNAENKRRRITPELCNRRPVPFATPRERAAFYVTLIGRTGHALAATRRCDALNTDRRALWARVLSFSVALSLCACGGGGDSSSPPAAAGSTANARPTTTLRIVVPQPAQAATNSRRPAYVSAGAQSLSLAIYPVAGDGTIATTPSSTTNVDLVASSICSGTPLACSIPINAPVGIVTFGVSLYSQTGEGGSLLATFAPSAQNEFAIVLNTNNVIGISLDGVPAALHISIAPATLTAGTAATATITVVAHDGSNNVIVGSDPYASAIALVDNDPTGNTTLSSASVLSPVSTVTLNYAGGPLTGSAFTLAAQYPGSTSVGATVSVGILNTTGVTAVPATVAFGSPAQAPQTVTYGEASYTGGFTINSSACSGVASVLDLSGTLRVSPIAAGSCTVTIGDNGGRSASVAIGVTQTVVVGD
jgi:hypothetical protein